MNGSHLLKFILAILVIQSKNESTTKQSCLLSDCMCKYTKETRIDEIDCRNLWLRNFSSIQTSPYTFQINSIDISRNYIDYFDYDYFAKLSITKFNASHNRINKIVQNQIENLAKFEIFDLSHNDFKSLNSYSFVPIQYSLRQLYLVNNKLKSSSELNGAFKQLENLELLDLSQNLITNIPEISHLNGLKQLNLNDNQIETLEQVDAAITFLQSNSLPGSLIELHLASNQLRQINELWFMNLFKLKKLDLSNNRISFINKNSFKNLNDLTHLYLQNNSLSRIPSETIYKLANLGYLDLSHQSKPFNTISNYAFERENAYSKFDVVLLNGNEIQTINKKAFCSRPLNDTQRHVTIRNLSLTGNYIKNPNACIFQQLNSRNHKSGFVYVTLDTILEAYTSDNASTAIIDCLNCDSANYLAKYNIFTKITCQQNFKGTHRIRVCNGSEASRYPLTCDDSDYSCYETSQKQAIMNSASVNTFKIQILFFQSLLLILT